MADLKTDTLKPFCTLSMNRYKAKDNAVIYSKQKNMAFHYKSLWLFTRSDLESMIYPNIVFAYASALSDFKLTTNNSPNIFDITFQIPAVFFWLWINLLLFNISNQRLPSSALEDAVNKPWRPIPSQRISPAQARYLLLCVIPVVLLSSLLLDVLWHSLFLIVLTWMYNDLGAADDHFVIRNLINATGMAFYSTGALQIACGKHHSVNGVGLWWICMIATIVFTTLQLQDMGDQAGDRLKGRKTLPLVMGDRFARQTIAGGVLTWSFVAPFFWRSTWSTYLLPITLGFVLSFRVLVYRRLEADRLTWKMWCFWIMSIYLVPLSVPRSGAVKD